MRKTFQILLVVGAISINIGMTDRAFLKVETLEGFYSRSWENSSFNQIRNKNVYIALWTEFDKDLENISSIDFDEISSTKLSQGIYLKVEGSKIGGGNHGHLGASDSLLTITKIIEIDTTRTFYKFFKKEEK